MDGCGECVHFIGRVTGCKGSAGCRTPTIQSATQTAVTGSAVITCFQIAKARDVGIKVQLDRADRAVTLF